MNTLFGTNGVRGIVNEDLTADKVLRLGKAIGVYLRGTVAVATDTRVTADMMKHAVSAGLMASGCRVLDLAMVPTPVLQYFVKKHDYVDGGVMITASHNPPEYNGVECIFSDGTELNRAGEEKIESYYNEGSECLAPDKIGTYETVEGSIDSYIAAILEHLDLPAIRRANLKVVVDCANGAASVTAPLLLKKLGVTAITLNANPQGEFPGRPSEPTEANLHDLMALTKSSKSDFGVAHDADGDRVVFVTSKGKFVSGDKSLALMAEFILSKRKGVFVTPVSSSAVVEDVVSANGGTVVYTEVGSPVVAKKMREVAAVFGGEENGGMIFPEHQYCRDAAMSLAKMIECVISKGPLHKQIDTLPSYFMIKKDVLCPEDKKHAVLGYIRDLFHNELFDETDGLKIIYDDGWILVRPSGTEPKFRIFSESKDESLAKERAENLETEAVKYLKATNV